LALERNMILTCPACQTRFRVDDSAIGADGRTVRCANCGHVWRYSRETAIEVSAAGATAPATLALAEAGGPATPAPIEPTPRVEPPSVSGSSTPAPAPVVSPRTRATEAVPPPAPRRGGAGLGWAALILIVAAAILVAILARDKIVAMWPQAARIYALAHLKVEQPTVGLDIKVTPSRTADSLVIDGDITNTAGSARTVPRLRVALRDANKNELDSKVIDPPVESLLPGATAHFTTSFPNPNPNAAGVAVTFATE
jgi:predicted Zn finger-like uncharacterized protein